MRSCTPASIPWLITCWPWAAISKATASGTRQALVQPRERKIGKRSAKGRDIEQPVRDRDLPRRAVELDRRCEAGGDSPRHLGLGDRSAARQVQDSLAAVPCHQPE